MSLRYGYVSNGLTGHRLDQALELLSANGYDGIALTLDHTHLDPYGPDPRGEAGALRDQLEHLGMSVVVETGGRFVLDPARKHHPTLMSDGYERRIDFIERAIGIAVECASPVVSMWSGAIPAGMDRDAAWARLVEATARLTEEAGRSGVKLGFEPEPGMLVDTLAEWDRLADALGRPEPLGMTLDIGHCVCLEPEPVDDCVRHAAPHLVHVHIEDMRRGVHEHLPFGSGELDLGRAIRALEDVGYAGMVAVELSRNAHEAHLRVPESIRAMRAHERTSETAAAGS